MFHVVSAFLIHSRYSPMLYSNIYLYILIYVYTHIHTEAAKSIASPVFPILPQDEALFQKMKYEFLLQIFGLNFE